MDELRRIDAESLIHADLKIVDNGDALVYEIGSVRQQIFLDPKLNHTPAQFIRIMKLRRLLGQIVVCRDEQGTPRAEIVYLSDGDATIELFAATGGATLWKDTLAVDDCLPDTPEIVPKVRPSYRALAASFMLFLLILFPIMLLFLRPRPYWTADACIGVLVTVILCVVVLTAVRYRLKL